MLHGPASKGLVWALTLAGLTPAVLLGLVSLFFSAAMSAPPQPPELGQDVHVSNVYVQVGPVRIDNISPSLWASLALLLGTALVVGALVTLLHKPWVS